MFNLNCKTALLLSALLLLPLVGNAIGLDSGGILPAEQRAAAIPEMVDEPERVNWTSAQYGTLAAPAADTGLKPFGHALFNGGFSGVRGDGLNQNYRLVPGDMVTLRIWGAVEVERELPVDAQGNIFIPSIGPVRVQGLTNGQLNDQVTKAVRSVYPDNVRVYTNLQGVQPVAVFVTGYVKNPGHYAGTPNDSMLYFLGQAGGIDDQLGSYRNIKVLRGKQTIARADLYSFLLSGSIPQLQFQDGDTLVVEARAASIVVSGDVEREYRYELPGASVLGQELLSLARLQADASHVLVRGVRDNGPISVYLSLQEFATQQLRHGDEVLFSADQRDETIVVQLEGSFYGPSRYALPKDARLHEFLDSIAVPEGLTAVNSVSLRRLSVAARQKESLVENLRRLETTYLGASSSSAEEASIRIKEAELIKEFVRKAEQVEPTGRMVVSYRDRIADIRLQDGDVITLPEISDSLLISGEVMVPRAVVYTRKLDALDYIASAGGFSQRADKDRILVVRQNGEIRDADDVKLRPGDEILVLPKAPTKNIQLATSISQILYQIAVATKVAIDL